VLVIILLFLALLLLVLIVVVILVIFLFVRMAVRAALGVRPNVAPLGGGDHLRLLLRLYSGLPLLLLLALLIESP